MVLGTALLVFLNSAPRNASADTSYSSLVSSNTAFALSLFDQLTAQQPTANIFFSPYSISTCLGMLYAGARGDTASQMAEALDFNTNQADVGPEFGALQAYLNSQQGTNGVDLSVANGLWAQANFPFLLSFLANVSTNYDASVQSVNFVTNAPQICDQINGWVAAKTEDMIPKLLSQGSLNADTRLVLVDAIYFKGGWTSIFNTNNTFHRTVLWRCRSDWVCAHDGANLKVCGIMRTVSLQAVELPYTNSSVTMVVLLPKTDAPEVVVAHGTVDGARRIGDRCGVDVKLPKFKLDVTTDLVPVLKDLGMVDAFLCRARRIYSGIDGAKESIHRQEPFTKRWWR